MFRPSFQPSSTSACLKAFPIGLSGSLVIDINTPIRRTRSGCCARATIGHATAAAPSRLMNSLIYDVEIRLSDDLGHGLWRLLHRDSEFRLSSWNATPRLASWRLRYSWPLMQSLAL